MFMGIALTFEDLEQLRAGETIELCNGEIRIVARERQDEADKASVAPYEPAEPQPFISDRRH